MDAPFSPDLYQNINIIKNEQQLAIEYDCRVKVKFLSWNVFHGLIPPKNCIFYSIHKYEIHISYLITRD